MATAVMEVYDALVEAGASESKARAAAEAISSYNERFHGIESRLLVLQWMVGSVILGVISLIAKVYA